MNKGKVNLQNLINRLRKSNLFIIISVLLVLLSSVITITQGFSIIKEQYSQSIGYKRKMIKNLSLLSADVNIGYFINILGNPVFINNYEIADLIKGEFKDTNLSEYVFVHEYYFVQALTDDNDRIVAYSVTTRKGNFNPKLELGPFTRGEKKPLIIELGKTKFKELSGDSQNVVSFLGIHNFYYHEAYYFGNPGNYQAYVFTLNEAGYAGLEEELNPYTFLPPDKNITENLQTTDPDIQKFRDNAVINTYTVTSPGELFGNELTSYRFGPKYHQVRILPRD